MILPRFNLRILPRNGYSVMVFQERLFLELPSMANSVLCITIDINNHSQLTNKKETL